MAGRVLSDEDRATVARARELMKQADEADLSNELVAGMTVGGLQAAVENLLDLVGPEAVS